MADPIEPDMTGILSTSEIIRALVPYVAQRWPEHELAPGGPAFVVRIDTTDAHNEVTVHVKLKRKG